MAFSRPETEAAAGETATASRSKLVLPVAWRRLNTARCGPV